MAKIAVVSESLKMGGTEVAILALLRKLVDENHKVTLYLIGKHGELIKRIPPGVKVKEVEFISNKYRLIADTSANISRYDLISRLKRKIFMNRKKDLYEFLLKRCVKVEEEYDLVCDAFGYGRFTTVYAALCLKGRKKALWFHDENLHWIDKCEKYFKYFDKFFCVSTAVMSELKKKEKEISDKCEVLHNFIEIDKIREKSEELIVTELKDGFNILTIARLEVQKGIDIAIETAKILYDKNLNFNWYVIGDGSLKLELEERIKKMNLENNFVLLGLKSNPYPYLKKCNLYVQPSRHEGYPITLVEARALFCTIVATNIPSISEQIIDGKNGFLVNLSPLEFSRKIEEIMNNSNKTKKIMEYLKSDKIDFSSDFEKIKKLLE